MDKKRNIKVEFSESTHNDMSMIAEISTSPSDLQVDDFDQEFAIMTLRNMVVFPSSILPVSIGRKSTLKLAKNAAKNEEHIIIATQKIAEVEEPGFNDLHPTAVMGRVLRVLDLPGGEISAIIQTSNVKVKIEEVTAVRPYLKGHVSVVEKQEDPEESKEIKVLLDTCRETAQKFIESSDRMNPDFAFALKNFKQPTLLVNFICTNFPLPLEDKFKLLDQLSFKDCIYDLISQCEEVLSDKPLFFAVNSYTTGLSPAVMEYMLKTTLVPRFGGKTSCDEIGLPVSATGGVVPCGATAIWEE